MPAVGSVPRVPGGIPEELRMVFSVAGEFVLPKRMVELGPKGHPHVWTLNARDI